MNIAIYGKGGIGKSTITTCISVAAAKKGKKVLQIGCDPKHDSTLCLLDGKKITTVIEAIDNIEDKSENIIIKGIHKIDCVEIGGPEPGVGCAGRGIISGLFYLEQMKEYQNNTYDLVTYDILGDVVCGGFFEPLKKRKVEKMYIVTSGEFNSIFAANNLCKGYRNCMLSKKGIALAGIIGNCRGIEKEKEIIETFCNKVNVPLVAIIPRDENIEKCTMAGTNIIDSQNNLHITECINKIIQNIESESVNYEVYDLELEDLRKMYKEVIE